MKCHHLTFVTRHFPLVIREFYWTRFWQNTTEVACGISSSSSTSLTQSQFPVASLFLSPPSERSRLEGEREREGRREAGGEGEGEGAGRREGERRREGEEISRGEGEGEEHGERRKGKRSSRWRLR